MTKTKRKIVYGDSWSTKECVSFLRTSLLYKLGLAYGRLEMECDFFLKRRVKNRRSSVKWNTTKLCKKYILGNFSVW